MNGATPTQVGLPRRACEVAQREPAHPRTKTSDSHKQVRTKGRAQTASSPAACMTTGTRTRAP
eukprot:4017662-Pleurochrysis_carterae.AAC.1